MSCTIALGFACTAAGCGSGDNVTSVSGRITLNGAHLTSGHVLAVDDTERTVHGKIKADGSFTLARGEQPVIPPGNYRVAVVAYENDGIASHPEADLKLLVPSRYTQPNGSGLTFSVSAGESKEVAFKNL